jgi:predicted RNA-binding Zn ribbon-like protein
LTASELIRDFVNTRDLLEEKEALGSPGELVSWLDERKLTQGEVRATAADLRHATELREALRQLLLEHTGVEVDREAASGVLDSAARRARIELRFEQCATSLTPAATGVEAALGQLVIAVQSAMEDDSWDRLKACRASDCEWAFIDNARNHSRAWCSMKSCGNREKARAFRERHRHE